MQRRIWPHIWVMALLVLLLIGLQPGYAQESTYTYELSNFNQMQYENAMLNQINQARQKEGIAPLKVMPQLVELARLKSQDMIDKKYFSHTSPTYGSPFEMLEKFGVSYRTAGENLAGHYSVAGAHEALMNSAGHKRNILNPAFTHVGIGIVKGGPYGMMFTQLFAGEPSYNQQSHKPNPDPRPQEPEKQEKPPESQIATNQDQLEKQMLELINKDRALNGKKSLRMNKELTDIARKKAQDMEEKGYLGYNSPAYGKTSDMLSQAGIRYSKLAESIVAAGKVETAHKALMAAGAHKNNILSTQVQEVGVGIVKSSRYGYIMVEIFLGTESSQGNESKPEPKPEPQPKPQPEKEPGSNSGSLTAQESKEYEMLALINKAREEVGIAPLVMDKKLVQVARIKSQDMIDKNYFSHTSPTYGSPFAMLNSFGVDYRYAGENLAGHYSLPGAHQALMNSPGHKQNILNPNFTHVGIGIVEGGPYNTMFTQMFVGY